MTKSELSIIIKTRMLYLLYLRNGFIKKFPLDKRTIYLGRSKGCDFFIDEPFVSKEHARLLVQPDCIDIEDLGSTNGVFVENEEVKSARVQLNQWFRIGYLKFFLKEGNAAEFLLSDKVQPLFNRISKAIETDMDKTNAAVNILYAEPLVEMLQIGFALQEYGNLFKHAAPLLASTLQSGCLLLVSGGKGGKIESQWNFKDQYHEGFQWILGQTNLFKEEIRNAQTNDHYNFCSFPVFLKDQAMVLIYIAGIGGSISERIIDFLEILAVEISVIHSLVETNQQSRKEGHEEKAPKIITQNPGMLHLLSRAKKIAWSNLFVLIEGDTGTGKELLARFIHFHSQRKGRTFIALNCAAIPENLMEVELFGHEKGAFTDASGQRKGKLELASGGTLVLDEIGDMPLNLQAKLLRTIQESQFYRVGGNTAIKVDLRIICMTNKNVKELMRKHLFRDDLYYRIAHVSLKIPTLRERREDIVPLIDHFTAEASKLCGVYIKGFSNRAVKAMETYDWPGNIREFENEMVKILSLSENGDIIDLDALKEEIAGSYAIIQTGNEWENERDKLLMLLEKHKWNKSLVAKALNYSRTTLYEKLKKYNI